MSNGNPFYVEPGGDYSQGLASLSATVQQIGQQKREDEVRERSEKRFNSAQTEITAAMESRDPNQLATVVGKYPEFQKVMQFQLGILKEGKKTEASDFMTSVLSDPDNAHNLYRKRIETLQTQGRDASESIQSYRDYMANPQGELKKMEMVLATVDPERYKVLESMKKEDDKKVAKLGAVSPKDFTVKSMSTYAETGDIGDLVRYTPKVKDIAGVPHQYNQQTLRWEPLVDMRSQGLSEQSAAATELKAAEQSRLDFEKQKSKFQAGESKLVSKISSARSKHKILADTAEQMKIMRSGWNTKYGAALRGLPATEARKMKGLIDTIRANSAFGTLSDLKASGGTLGAISAPELELLEAALGTLDQFGDNQEQVRVIDQILEANQSSIDRLDNAYDMDRKKYGTSFEEAKQVEQEEISDEDILSKYLGAGA